MKRFNGLIDMRRNRRLLFVFISVCSILYTTYTLLYKHGVVIFSAPYLSQRFIVIGLSVVLLSIKHKFTLIVITTTIIGHTISIGKFWILPVSFINSLVYLVIGRSILTKLFRSSRNDLSEAFFVGMAFIAVLIDLTASIPIHMPIFYVIFGLAVLVLNYQSTAYVLRMTTLAITASVRYQYRLLDRVLISMFCLYFLIALLPESGSDALCCHLQISSQLEYNSFYSFPFMHLSYALMPKLANWILSIPYLFAGESASRFFNVIILAFGLCKVSNLFYKDDDTTSKAYGRLLVVTTPLIYLLVNALNQDIIWMSYVSLSIVYLWRLQTMCTDTSVDSFLIACLYAGVSLATKWQTLLYAPIIGILIVFSIQRFNNNKLITPKFCILSLVSVLIGSLPFVRSYIMSSNPVFPLYNKYFKSPYWPAENFIDGRWAEQPSWTTIYDMSFDSQKFLEGTLGSIGFQWSLFLLTVLVLIATHRMRQIYLLGLIVLQMYFIVKFIPYARYLAPLFILGSLLITQIVSDYANRYSLDTKANMIYNFNILLNLLFLGSATWANRSVRVDPLGNIASLEKYKDNNVMHNKAIWAINNSKIPNTNVLFIGSPFGAGVLGRVTYSNWYSFDVERYLKTNLTISESKEFIKAKQITHIALEKSTTTGLNPDYIRNLNTLYSDDNITVKLTD